MHNAQKQTVTLLIDAAADAAAIAASTSPRYPARHWQMRLR
jgi:hypothetical protein